MSSSYREQVTIDEFSKLDLRVARVLDASRIEGTNLIKLRLDVGSLGERQVIAGLGRWYDPGDLVGRSVVLVANLKPKKIRGYISEGMILAAGCGDSSSRPRILTVDDPDGVEPGSKVC